MYLGHPARVCTAAMRLRILTIVAPHLFDVRLNATLRATGGSMRVGGPVARDTTAGPLVTVVTADAASAAAVTDAAHLWNGYHPNYTGPLARVTGQVVSNWAKFDDVGPDTIGLALCSECSGYTPRMCCGITDLYVLDVVGGLMFDVFVHEIAHAVLPATATAYNGNRQLRPLYHHWDPYEPGEIFGPYISSTPFLATYTVAAADVAATTVCAGDLPACAPPLQCAAVDGYQRVPGRCAMAAQGLGPLPAGAPEPTKADTDDGFAGSVGVWSGLAAAVVLVLALVVLVAHERDSYDTAPGGEFL